MLNETMKALVETSSGRLREPKTGAVNISGKAPSGHALERIIEASRLEFSATGLAAAKIDSIAARANVTRQSVYYYYRNKEEIFYDLVIREADILIDQFDYLDIEAAAPDAAIKDLLWGLLDNAARAPILSAFMVDKACFHGSDKKAKTIFTNMMKQVTKRLQVLLDRGAAQGTLRPGVDAARFFAAACMITSGAKNSGSALKMTCGVDVNNEEGMSSWQLFAVDLLMRSIRAVD